MPNSDNMIAIAVDRCKFCGRHPVINAIRVHYHSPRKSGLHNMHRAECECGAIGKCRPDPIAAAEAWNEPWQALPLKDDAPGNVAIADREKSRAA